MRTQTSTTITWEEAVQWLRQQPEQAALVEACFYDAPLIGAAERYYHSYEWQELKKYLPSQSGTVCDVGAGRGISSYAFARDGWQVTSIEPGYKQYRWSRGNSRTNRPDKIINSGISSSRRGNPF